MLLAVKNKASTIKLAATPPAPVFEIAIRQRGAKASAPNPKSEKRDNIFSKSRDTREDRGTREMKTSHNAQTLSRAR
jgi:hypothetical protein